MPAPAPELRWTQLIALAIIILIVVVRTLRPQRISVTRLWLAPILLVAISVLLLWLGQQSAPAPAGAMAAAIVAGLAAGIPVGLLRGRHIGVRRTDRPGVMYLDSSWVGSVMWVAAIVVRMVIRSLLPPNSITATIVGDGVLLFAIAMYITTYYAVYNKFRALPEVRTADTQEAIGI